MSNTEHFIFYHSNANLDGVKTLKDISNINYVNLDEISIPTDLVVSGLTQQQNKAIYSEFLGILTIKPTKDMVGLFTYSIPHKYNYDFAKELGYPLTEHSGKWMLPPIKFDYLESKKFETNNIYGAYFRPYIFEDDPSNDIIIDINANSEFKIENKSNDESGPFNGTAILSKNEFMKFQSWLLRVTKYILDKYGWDCFTHENMMTSEDMNRAGTAKESYESNSDKEFDLKFRRGIGHVLERCFAYYLGRNFKSENRVDMKKHLNDKTKMYIFSSPSHDEMKYNYFLPSIKDDFEIVEEHHQQECKTGEYHSDGWESIVHQKIDLIIRAIHENWGGWFIHSDVDIQFFSKIEKILETELQGRDIVFQNDCPYPRPVACAGFFACRGNEKTLKLWESVKKVCIESKIDDQVAVNLLLHDRHEIYKIDGLKWRLLPTSFYSPGNQAANFIKIDKEYNKDCTYLMDKVNMFDHGWRWTPDQKPENDNDYVHPSMKELQIPVGIVMHHANYTEGIQNKIMQLRYVKLNRK